AQKVYDGVILFFSSRRRHTRCLSDWSSDVCSSDLHPSPGDHNQHSAHTAENHGGDGAEPLSGDTRFELTDLIRCAYKYHVHSTRSEERRGGKECRQRRVKENKKEKCRPKQ